jgi:hypothetical protein
MAADRHMGRWLMRPTFSRFPERVWEWLSNAPYNLVRESRIDAPTFNFGGGNGISYGSTCIAQAITPSTFHIMEF